jgi:hypothetical protein
LRRSQPNQDPEAIRLEVISLLSDFAAKLKSDDLRSKVIALVPAFQKLRDLGCSLVPGIEASAAKDRVLAYLRHYPHIVINGDELMVVSGIAEWARRVRELRVQFGWAIYSGVTFRDMAEAARAAEDDEEIASLESAIGVDPSRVKPDQYVLMKEEQDRQSAHRWNVLNEVRRKKISVTDKIIEYFRKNVGEQITGEELKYLAKDKKEWAVACGS